MLILIYVRCVFKSISTQVATHSQLGTLVANYPSGATRATCGIGCAKQRYSAVHYSTYSASHVQLVLEQSMEIDEPGPPKKTMQIFDLIKVSAANNTGSHSMIHHILQPCYPSSADHMLMYFFLRTSFITAILHCNLKLVRLHWICMYLDKSLYLPCVIYIKRQGLHFSFRKKIHCT